MPHPVDLSQYFTQNHYSQFLHCEAGYMTPIFYEIKDHHGTLKGFLLGTHHDKFKEDVPQILGRNSKIWKCFKQAKKFATESDPRIIFPIFLERPYLFDKEPECMRNSMDFIFIEETFKDGKPCHGLEFPTDPVYAQVLHEFTNANLLTKLFISIFKPTAESFLKGENEMSRYQHGLRETISKGKQTEAVEKAALFGSEESMARALSRGSQKEKKETQERNHTMTLRADTLMQHSEGPLFIAIGMAHLPGEKGVCNLLRQKGYTVQRVY